MKNSHLIVSVLLLCTFCAFGQEQTSPTKTYTKKVNGKTLIVKEGTLQPNQTIQSAAPTLQIDHANTISPTENSPAPHFAQASSPLANNLPSWSEMTNQQQINYLSKEIDRLKKSNAEKLRIQKLEELLEKKKLQTSFQTN